jgi:hypothetical protein
MILSAADIAESNFALSMFWQNALMAKRRPLAIAIDFFILIVMSLFLI